MADKQVVEQHATSHLLGVDTGGTFTDFALLELNTGSLKAHKVLSTPNDPAIAILTGIEQLGLNPLLHSGRLQIIHGSTVATNAALERKGVRTAFITNSGLKDILTIGRQTRKELYQLQPQPHTPPVPESLCFEIDCRLNAKGQSIRPLTDHAIEKLLEEIKKQKPEAIAINLLFSYLDDRDEKRIEQALGDAYFVSRSSFVLPEPGEFERGIVTWLNAYLGPKVNGYLHNLHTQVQPCPLAVMQSNGGTIDAQQAGLRAVNLLLSGPAGGLAGTRFLGKRLNQQRFLTFDMGGTSTDVALIDGDIQLTTGATLAGLPISVPMVNMHTIGAGGGSLAFVDNGGLLQVGPESAGANPGPACYGLGGSLTTVTDANAILGRLRPENPLGGNLNLDVIAAQSAIRNIAERLQTTIDEAAKGVIDLVNEKMAAALRVISVNQGYDPQEFMLCCFGGAGGLHVCALADSLNMTKAVIPALGGVFSALGMLTAPRVRQLALSRPKPLSKVSDQWLTTEINHLSGQGSEQLCAEGVDISEIATQISLDLRYEGQSHCLNISFETQAQSERDFHQMHQSLYGHRLNLPIELVTIRTRSTAPAAVSNPRAHAPHEGFSRHSDSPTSSVDLIGLGTTSLWMKDQLASTQTVIGPALICEPLSSTLVATGWQANVDNFGNILLTKL